MLSIENIIEKVTGFKAFLYTDQITLLETPGEEM